MLMILPSILDVFLSLGATVHTVVRENNAKSMFVDHNTLYLSVLEYKFSGIGSLFLMPKHY